MAQTKLGLTVRPGDKDLLFKLGESDPSVGLEDALKLFLVHEKGELFQSRVFDRIKHRMKYQSLITEAGEYIHLPIKTLSDYNRQALLRIGGTYASGVRVLCDTVRLIHAYGHIESLGVYGRSPKIPKIEQYQRKLLSMSAYDLEVLRTFGYSFSYGLRFAMRTYHELINQGEPGIWAGMANTRLEQILLEHWEQRYIEEIGAPYCYQNAQLDPQEFRLLKHWGGGNTTSGVRLCTSMLISLNKLRLQTSSSTTSNELSDEPIATKSLC